MDTAQSPAPAREKIFAAAFIAFYILARLAADPFLWRNISEIYSFSFEIAFIGAVHWVFSAQIRIWARPTLKDLLYCAVAFLAGALIYRAAFLSKLGVPYDLSSPQIIFLLVFFGPVLEEEVFRMALWQPFQVLFRKKWVTIGATTFLFALGHFMAYWYVPPSLKIFIIYQTLYVTALGLAIAIRRHATGAVSSGIWIHMAFNFGFLCAYNWDGLLAGLKATSH